MVKYLLVTLCRIPDWKNDLWKNAEICGLINSILSHIMVEMHHGTSIFGQNTNKISQVLIIIITMATVLQLIFRLYQKTMENFLLAMDQDK